MIKEETLRKSIEDSINRVSRENNSNTPDYILAHYLMACLLAFETATQQRDPIKVGMRVHSVPIP